MNRKGFATAITVLVSLIACAYFFNKSVTPATTVCLLLSEGLIAGMALQFLRSADEDGGIDGWTVAWVAGLVPLFATAGSGIVYVILDIAAGGQGGRLFTLLPNEVLFGLISTPFAGFMVALATPATPEPKNDVA